MSDVVVGPGRQVTLHFALKLEDGQVVDSNFDGQPATFVVGDGNLPKGFEQVIYGLSEGDQGSFRIPPAGAFGMPNPENIREFARDIFSKDMSSGDMELQEGLVVSFADAANTELAGVVTGLTDSHVEVDFNHPLAGKELLFEVRILNITQATHTPEKSAEA
ncbi:FKBP-type peptidyl-prolyl cis-trans isomerase [Endozoicomonas numazuensis]|uniref:Peptidyl-prolyl cis-trans isomerase n=1 Tax=Endozoicomonas numazuensis TaxID=1137799 RepID=A0A081N984_9GAMM|nr:peptidylprolyl isomerase [Endozoicomonas numazuensis]KEQ15007.1 peptidylprolyl isomerase [Endozoicomonas numazuensis]